MIIDKYLYGWSHLESVIIGSISAGFNVLLLGKHGCGKSSIARFFADALSDENKKVKFIRYAMDKESLITMVGIPNPEELKNGHIKYATHERSIFLADVALFDELTRAPKETQNMVLEILEEKTIFGIPLDYKFAIATANDESYKATFKMDAALLDRFYCVIPVPTTDIGTTNESFCGADALSELILLNTKKRKENLGQAKIDLVDLVKKTQTTFKELCSNPSIVENIVEFTSRFFAITMQGLKSSGGSKVYISPRQIGVQFPRLALAIAAYYKAIDESDFLQKGVIDAIKYSIATKLAMPLDKLMQTYLSLADLLTDKDIRIQKIRIALTTGNIDEKINALRENIKIVQENFEVDEVISSVGNMITESAGTVRALKAISNILQSTNLNERCLYMAKLHLYDALENENHEAFCGVF